MLFLISVFEVILLTVMITGTSSSLVCPGVFSFKDYAILLNVLKGFKHPATITLIVLSVTVDQLLDRIGF